MLRRIDATRRRSTSCADAASSTRPRPAGPGPCADGVEPVQCPRRRRRARRASWTCGDPMMYCSKPCTPGYAGDDGPGDRHADVAAVRPVGDARRAASSTTPTATSTSPTPANHLIRMIDTAGHRAPRRGAAAGGRRAADAATPATAVRRSTRDLNYPVDLALGDDGTLYFTDVRNHCVRAIEPDGHDLDTVVGVCGNKGYERRRRPRRRGAAQPAVRHRVRRRPAQHRGHRQQRDPLGAVCLERPLRLDRRACVLACGQPRRARRAAATTTTAATSRSSPRTTRRPTPRFAALPAERRPRPQQRARARRPGSARSLPGPRRRRSPSARSCSRKSTTSAT